MPALLRASLYLGRTSARECEVKKKAFEIESWSKMASGTHRLQQGYAYNYVYKVYSSTPHPFFTWRPNDPNLGAWCSLAQYYILSSSLLPSDTCFPSFRGAWPQSKPRPTRRSRPPSLSPLFVILFLYLERQPRPPPPSPSRARSVCPSVDLGAHSLHHSFTSTRETIHRESERGLEAACSVLRPPLILACIIKQVPQSQTAARCTLHCR